MSRHLILISGKARAGKDTFSIGLDGYQKYSFAGQLKEFAEKLGWDGEKNERGRKFLQDLASVVREYNSNTWIRILGYLIEDEDYPDKVVVTDCRYLNEIQLMKQWSLIHNYKVTTIRIERPGFDNGLTEAQKNHPSETELDNYPFDYVIKNSGTIGDLMGIAYCCASGAHSELTLQDGRTSF